MEAKTKRVKVEIRMRKRDTAKKKICENMYETSI